MGRLIDADALKAQMLKYGFCASDMTVTEFVEDCLPTIEERKWIPCSERLPELKEWVLVSSGDCVVSDCLAVRGGNKIWYECGTIDIEHDAWQPLPSPYKEDTK